MMRLPQQAPTGERSLLTSSTKNLVPPAARSIVPRRRDPAGNQANLRRLQAKLTVGSVNDALEQEADAAADRVMSIAEPQISLAAPPMLSRKCQHCEEEEEEEKGALQRKTSGDGAAAVQASPIVDAVLSSPGRPLDTAAQAFMGNRFAADFSGVRIHTDTRAAQSADEVGALAYTVGSDIVFGAGQFDPGSFTGRHLLAHELAHTLQQGDLSAAAHTVIARRPKKPGTPAAKTQAAPRQQTPAWETSLAVVNAIADIINIQVREKKDGLVYETQYPAQHPEVPPEHKPLLEEWYLITHGASVHNKPGRPSVTIRGPMLKTHIDMAVAQTMPFINELLKDGEPESTGAFLEESIFRKIGEFRHRAVVEDVGDTIAAGAKVVPKTARTDLERATEEEKLKAELPEAVETVARANLVVNQFLHGTVEETVEHAEKVAKLEELFEKIRHQALQAGEAENSSVLKPIMRMDLPGSLVFLHGMLDAAGAILTVADPEERKKLFEKRMTWAGEAARVTDVVKLLEQCVAGAVAVTGAATYALARITGNSKLAAEVFAKGIPNVENAVFVLNVISAIHGVLVLLDEDASGEEKAKAALDVGVGGIGIAGRLAPSALGEIAGPLSATLIISFYTLKWLGDAAVGATVGFVKGGLNGVYEDMKKTALEVQATALKLATAAQLASVEPDHERAKELLSQAEGLRWNLVDFMINPYVKRATVPGSRRNVFGFPAINDPASWSNELIRRFKPLVGRPGRNSEQALGLAADFLQIVAKCFADQQYILDQTVDEAVKEQ